MRLGINMPFRRADGNSLQVQELMDHAAAIERVGFDGIWIGDTVGRWNSSGIDTMQWLLACAASTKTIELGTAVLVVPLRYPVELAQRIMSLYALSGGRFTCAVGSGSLPLDFNAVGVDHSKRFKLFNDGVSTIKKLLDGETVGTANIHPWPDVQGKARLAIASWYNGPWIKRAAESYDGWVASGLNSTFAELRDGIKRYRDFGGTRAMVATVGVNFDASSPALTDDTNFTLRCGFEEAKERVARLADLGFDDLLMTGGFNFAPEDMPEEKLAKIVSLRPADTGRRSSIIDDSPSQATHERAQDPVCRRFIDLTTMSSPTSRQVFTREHSGQAIYLCSEGCAEAFDKNPAGYVRA